MIQVKLPDGSTAQFPDGTPNDVMTKAIQAKFPPQQATAQPAAPQTPPADPSQSYAQGYPSQAISGIGEGMAGMLSLPATLANAALSVGPAIGNTFFGRHDPIPLALQAQGQSEIPDPGQAASQFFKDTGAVKPPTTDPGKQIVRGIGQQVGANIIPGMGAVSEASQPIKQIGRMLLSSTGAGLGGAGADAVAPNNPSAHMLGQVLGGFSPLAAESAMNRYRGPTAPSVADLKDKATGLYQQAEANGVTANRPQVIKLSDDLHQVAVDEGLISPTGRMASSYPKVTDALKMADDYSMGGSMSPTQMQQVRRSLAAAAGSSDGTEARIGSIMLRKFDNFTAPLSPELSAARDVYHTAMNGSRIDQAVELAHANAGTYSGAGFETALRNQFKALNRDIVKGNIKGLTQAEIDAIAKTANGGPIENILRFVGKLAPTGVVSALGGGGIGYAVGGPIGAAAVPLAGAAARGLATSLTSRNANLASTLARSGGQMPASPPLLNPDQIMVAKALLAANQGGLGQGQQGQ